MRVPLVVITGFLGAGKTTLVNRLLARRAAREAEGAAASSRLGVIVNELGEIGIDGALLGGEVARQIELPGGCVCCVLGDELDKTLLDLVGPDPQATPAVRPLEAVVLETTGVAEPLPIAWAVQREPVAARIRLAAVVTLVDATHFRASRPVTVAVDAQVAYADVLLITKAELAGEGEMHAVLETLRELAPRALIRIGSTDDHAAWLEQALADPSLERADDGGGPAEDETPHDHAGHDHDDGHCRHPDSHAHGVDSISLEVPGTVDLEELEDQLAELPANYVRIKGIVRAVDERSHDPSPGWVAVHRVGLRVSSERLVRKPDEFSGDRGRLVALGSELNHDRVDACVAAALAPA